MSKRTGKVTTFIGHRHLLPCYPIAPLLSGRRVESAPKTMEVAPTGVRFSAMRHLLPFCFATLLALNPAAGQSPTAAPKPAAPKLDYVGQIAAPLKPSRVITYKQVNGRELHLHVLHPEGWTAADKRACYITIHGGGLDRRCSTTDVPVCQSLCRAWACGYQHRVPAVQCAAERYRL